MQPIQQQQGNVSCKNQKQRQRLLSGDERDLRDSGTLLPRRSGCLTSADLHVSPMRQRFRLRRRFAIQLSKIRIHRGRSLTGHGRLALGRRRALLRLILEFHPNGEESIKCCHNAVTLTALARLYCETDWILF